MRSKIFLITIGDGCISCIMPRIEGPFEITIDHDQSLGVMIEAGRYDKVQPSVTEHICNLILRKRKFPVLPVQREIYLMHFAEKTTSEEVIQALDAMELGPAGLRELLALGAEHPDFQKDFPIVALAVHWYNPYWRHDVPMLKGPKLNDYTKPRVLTLDKFELNYWPPECRFAATRRRLSTEYLAALAESQDTAAPPGCKRRYPGIETFWADEIKGSLSRDPIPALVAAAISASRVSERRPPRRRRWPILP